MKRILLTLFGLLCFQLSYAQFSQITPNNCVATGVDTLFFSLSNAQAASTNGTLTFYYQGDIDGGVPGNEHFDLLDENNNLIGTSAPGIGGFASQCRSTQDSLTFIIPITDLTSWSADGVINFKAVRGSGVSQTLCTAPGSCVQIKLEFLTVSGQNDIGVAVINPLGSITCPLTLPVVADIRNYGTNQVTSATIDWEVNGVAQTPVSFTGVLDTIGGLGSAVSSITLGNVLFSAGTYDIKAWTSLPNGIVDTTNFNDTILSTQNPLGAPSGLSLQNITANSVDVVFSAATGVTYQVIVVPTGTPASAGTPTLPLPSSPITVNNLMPSTGYDVYLLGNCGTSLTDTAGPEAFVTPIQGPRGVTCITGSPGAILLEDFEGASPSVTGIALGNGVWRLNSGGTTSGSTGPLGAHQGSQYVYYETSGTNPTSGALVTGSIDLTSANDSAELSFWLHAFGATMGTLTVGVGSSATGPFTQVFTSTGAIQLAQADPWQNVGVRLDNYVGQNIFLEFAYTSTTSFTGDIALDLIEVTSCITCPSPSGQTLLAVTDTNATIGWDDPSGTNWDIEWGPVGFTQGTGSVTAVTNDTVAFGPLSSNTCYDVFVRTNCSASSNGVGAWRGPITFCTECAAFTAPYTQDFDGTTAPALDNCWTPVAFNASNANFELQTDVFRNFSPPNSMELHNNSAATGFLGIASPRFSDLDDQKRLEFFVYDEDGQFDGSDLIIGVMTDLSDETSFTALDTITEAEMDDDIWEFFVVDLTNNPITSGGGYVVFRHGMGSTFDNIHIDDFEYKQIPACQAPLITTLGTIAVTSGGASVSWGSGSAGIKTYVAWGSVGFVPQVGGQLGIDSVAGAVDQYSITGLSPQTTYEFYIQDSCATDGLSPWIGPFTFTTLCLPITAPFTETFDNSPWVAGTGFNMAGDAIDPCWDRTERVATNTYSWNVFSGPTSSSFGTGPSGDNTTGNGNYMATEGSNSATGTAEMYTPLVDVSGLTTPYFEFFYHRYGSILPNFLVEINDGTGWDSLFFSNQQEHFSNADPFSDFGVDISGYGDTVQVRFTAFGNGCCNSDMAFDDISFTEAPSCPKVINLNVSALSDVSAGLSWTGNSSTTSFEVWYGPQGFYQGTLTTGGTRQFTTTSPFSLSGLTPQTCYEFLVRGICQPGDTSEWVGPETFCTPCSPISAPYFEDWDGLATGKDLGCYASIEDPTFATNNFLGVNIVAAGLPFSAPNQIEFDNSSSAQPLALVSPPTTDLTVGDKRIKFRARMSFATAPSSTLIIGTMSVPSNASTFKPIDTIVLNANTPMDEYRVDLTVANGYNGTDVYYAILHGQDATFRTIYLDDFMYEVIPSCPAPFSGSTVNVSNTTADLQFVPGGAANFQIDFGAPNFTPSGSSANIINATTTTPTLTGLAANTNYDWYVRDSCSVGDVSNWTGPFSFTTLCNAFTAPFFEDFESNTLGFYEGIDNCWLLQNTVNKTSATSGYGWDLRNTSQTSSGTGTGADRDNTLAPSIGGQFFNADVSYGSAGDSSMLISPIIDISALTAPELEYHIHRLGTQMADFYVDIYDGTQWINGVHSYTNVGGIQSAQSDPYTDTIIDLVPYLGITNFQVRFRTISGGCCSGDNSLDDIRISDPISGDMDLVSADFVKSFCLNANDSITLQVVSTVDSVDFVANNLTGSYNVVGPVNSSGTFTINTGGLGVNDTLTITLGGIDLSQAGSYSLGAFIDQNANINVFPNRDTIAGITLDIQPNLQASPTTTTVTSIGDSVELCASSQFFGAGNFLFTEVRHFNSTGAGTVPAYVPDDYIEITGVPGSDLDGITLEVWTGTSAVVNYTFPAGTLIGPNGTAIIMQGQGATASDPANFVYDGRGTYTGTFGSGSVAGYILKDGAVIMDAVAYNGYAFSPATGVTSADWSGTLPGTAGTAGIRATGPDINSASNWTVVSAAVTQDAQVLNSGVALPQAAGGAGLSWSLVGSTVALDTTACIMVGGPFNATGVQQYVVTYTNGCGTFTDTVTVIIPNCTAPSNLVGNATGTNSATLSYDTTGTGATSFDIEYGTAGFVLGTGTVTTSSSNTISLTGLANNVCQDFYVRASCSTDSSAWVGPVNVCPDETICTDDIEQYATGLIENQSALFLPWQGGAGAGGTASVVTSQSASGTQSIRLSDPSGTAPDDIVAYFDTISTGAWEVSFEMYIPTGRNAYFNIQQNHALNAIGTNYWGGEVYFQGNGTAEVQYSTGTIVAGTFPYTQGQWNTVSTIIDLDNDSIWFELNGISTGVGYQYSLANVGIPLQFNGVNFYTGEILNDPTSSEYYIDDFCVSPANVPTVCNPVTQLSTTSAACDELTVNWVSNTGGSIIEYGPSPLTAGTGTFTGIVTAPQTFTGLTPGVAYDVLVADTCGNDTSSYASVTGSVANSPLPVAAYTSTLQTATLTGRVVDFNGSTTTAGTGATYNWDYGDGNSGTGVNSSHTYTANGTYNACLVVVDGCGTDSTCQQIVIEEISLTENLLSRSLEVFPNPAKDVVNVSFNAIDDADVNITITDAQGRAIMNISDKLGGTTYQKALDVSKLASGVYMIKVTSGDLVAMRRVSIGK
jgi:hypothetical protein